jgi:hypothetical protein
LKNIGLALLSTGILLAGIPCRADLLGSQVTGTLTFNGYGSTNYFNPLNGFVPGGNQYLNSAGTTVTIGSETKSTIADFGFADLYDTITTTFTANGVIVTDNGTGGNAWTQTFKDSAFVGSTFAKTFDNFLNGGLTVTLSGDLLTIAWAGTTGDPASTMDLTFKPALATAGVPEPSSLGVLLLLGVAGAGVRKLRKNFRGKAASF